jgi:hypothetical protein
MIINSYFLALLKFYFRTSHFKLNSCFKIKVFYFANKLNSKIKDYVRHCIKSKAIIVDKLGVDENEVVTEASFTNDLELTH